jgi:3-oxoacyl-[acyl-carrier protein] reductase
VSGRFEGRVALVTGASGGIGHAIARRLGAAGAVVAVHYGRNEAAARDLAGRLPNAAPFGADMFLKSGPDDLVDAVESELGPVDLLVANHGVARRGDIDDVDADDFDFTLAVNLRAPFLLARRVLPGMRERGFGRILFLSSVASFTGGIVGPHYAASKAGLHGLTHHLASRVAEAGLTVNAIAPALIEDTGMLPGGSDELRKVVPVGRLGKPDDVADLALAVIRNGYITNQVISVDGGMHPGG